MTFPDFVGRGLRGLALPSSQSARKWFSACDKESPLRKRLARSVGLPSRACITLRKTISSVGSRGMSAPPQRDDGALGRIDDAGDQCRQRLEGALHLVDVFVLIV